MDQSLWITIHSNSFPTINIFYRQYGFLLSCDSSMASDDNLLCHQTRLGNLGTIVLVDGKIIKAVAMITCRHLGQAATRAFSMALTFCLPTTKQWQGLGNLAGASPFLVSNQCCESLVKSERCGRSRVLWNLEDIEKRMGTDAATGHWCSNTPCATCSVLHFFDGHVLCIWYVYIRSYTYLDYLGSSSQVPDTWMFL